MRSLIWPPNTAVLIQAVAVYVPDTLWVTQFGLSLSVQVCVVVSGLVRSAAQPPLCPPATRVRLHPASGAQPFRFASKVELPTRLPATPTTTWTSVVVVSPAVSETDAASE